MAHALESPLSQKDSCAATQLSSARLVNDLNIPMKTKLAESEDDSKVENASLNPQPQQQGKIAEQSGQNVAQEERNKSRA